MNGTNKSATSRVLNTFAGMLLFLLFTICMLMMIGAAAATYSRINSGYETTYGSAAAIRYVSNKIRSSDSCKITDDANGIIVTNGSLITLIYMGSGGLYEKNVAIGGDVSQSGGELIIEADALSVIDNGGLYSIIVECGGDRTSVLVRKG
ncbi:MAG: DUF4860 domain-containing protein [Oscillospiraceae bacterium]|nr:DUF4860 domain-containing protein [Oscillospiraceae bacterium]